MKGNITFRYLHAQHCVRPYVLKLDILTVLCDHHSCYLDTGADTSWVDFMCFLVI